MVIPFLALSATLLGCAPRDAEPGDTARPTTTPDPTTDTCVASAVLELVPLDAWGRDAPEHTTTWDAAVATTRTQDDGPGVVRIPFGESPVSLRARLDAPDHVSAFVEARWDGVAFTFGNTGAVGLATSTGSRVDAVTGCAEPLPVTAVYVLLDHAWFAAQARPPTRNRVDVYTDGEAHWAAVAEDLAGARRRVTWSTWWWESSFELRRDDDAGVRAANGIMALFEALPDVERRVLINRFWADNADWSAYLNTDEALRDAAEASDDRFEVVLQGNPTEVPFYDAYTGSAAPVDAVARVRANPRYADRAFASIDQRRAVELTLDAASWHQKAMVFDGEVAWITGMNSKQTDWDGPGHAVFDPRRMEADASDDDRAAVASEESLPDNPPRKDYGVRVVGPAARDVEEVLQLRWDAALTDGSLYADAATPLVLDDAAASPDGGVPAQVVATLPPPWSDQSILETHGKAIRNASSYVFVEDQYFRAPVLNELLLQAMDANPDLVLIVVTQPVSASDGGAKYTYLSDAVFRERYPDRYLLLQLAAAELTVEPGWWWDDADVAVEPIYLHSKLRLVDDRYLSVGSCNMNNRGYLYEGELNLSVLDPAVARDVRARVFSHLVGEAWSPMLTDDPRNNLDVLALAAEENAAVLAWWAENAADYDDAYDAEAAWAAYAPSGFVLPLHIDDDYLWDVGPDAF